MEANNRERIEGRDFEQGGVYEVFSNDRNNYSLGIYFYPTSYPERMEYEYNTRGKLSKLFNKLSEPLELLILYSMIYNKGKYIKFDKSKIYGKQPVSIIGSERYSSDKNNLPNLNLSYAKLENSKLVGVDLSNAILSHANLTGSDLTGSDLSNAILSHANLTGSDLTGSDLTRANLSDAKLGKTILKNIKSSGIKGIPNTLTKGYYLVDGCIIGPDTKISENLQKTYRQIEIGNGNNTKQYLVGPNVDLAGVDLSQIKRFDLNNSDLTGANLTSVNLTGANLTGANLTGANLTNANFTGAKFYSSNLTGADLTGADLTGANLTTAKLSGIKSSLIRGIPKHLPKGYFLVDGIIIGPDIDIPNNNTLNTFIFFF